MAAIEDVAELAQTDYRAPPQYLGCPASHTLAVRRHPPTRMGWNCSAELMQRGFGVSPTQLIRNSIYKEPS
ncbi:hypothetical protein [Microbulbifer epialgicus]|uniref:Uncharacterized protein n=1 Tax=Microbulbifer epialgicus TaxID=393907 RepID=A0ABV4NUH9_9GAMM